MIRVMLVDDHALVRDGLRRILDQASDIDVVGIASRGADAVAIDAELQPEVILMDVSMPEMSGIDATRAIRASRKEAKVVMLTAASDNERVLAALDAGACGYLLKDADPSELIAGIRDAANGDVPLDARAARALLQGRRDRSEPELTQREREVLALVRDGLPNKVIARQLEISEKTVKSHLTKIYNSLGVTGRTQAALWARDHLPTK